LQDLDTVHAQTSANSQNVRRRQFFLKGKYGANGANCLILTIRLERESGLRP